MDKKELIKSQMRSYAIWYAYTHRDTDDGYKQFFDELVEDLRKRYPEWRVRCGLMVQIAIGQAIAEHLKANGLGLPEEEKVG